MLLVLLLRVGGRRTLIGVGQMGDVPGDLVIARVETGSQKAKRLEKDFIERIIVA